MIKPSQHEAIFILFHCDYVAYVISPIVNMTLW